VGGRGVAAESAAEVEADAVNDEAEAAEEERGSAVEGDDRRDGDREREAAVTARKIMNESGEENAQQATANGGAAFRSKGALSEADFRDGFAAKGALGKSHTSGLATERAGAHCVRLELNGRGQSKIPRTAKID